MSTTVGADIEHSARLVSLMVINEKTVPALSKTVIF